VTGDAGRHDELAVTGRFQPFHIDHLWLVRHALERATRVVVGVTNPDARSLVEVASSTHRHLHEANPLGFLARKRMIEASLEHAGVARGRYDVVPFPLEAPGTWSSYIPLDVTQLIRVFSEWESAKAGALAAGGYPVVTLAGDHSSRVAATDVRAAIREGRPWQQLVPDGGRQVLEELLVTGAGSLRAPSVSGARA
jgi:nicotinamide mononucleotide adenylyltransferase